MNKDDIKKIVIEVSAYCNLKCGLCIRQNVTKNKFLEIEAIENLKLESFKNAIISLYGGEPTLNPNILEILKCIKIPLLLGTNGGTHDELWWYNLPKVLPDKHAVLFALDGIDQETYSYYRIKGIYETVILNMKAFISGGGNAWWQFIMFAHNEHQVKDAEKLAQEYGCKRFMIIPSWSYNNKYQSPKTYTVKSEEHAERPDLLCRICSGEIFVSVDGDYMPCCVNRDLSHVLRVTGCNPFKNAYHDSLLEVVTSDYYTDMLKRIPTIEKCRKCLVVCGRRYSFNTSNIDRVLG